MELNRATQALGAYNEDVFVGVLLADMKRERKLYRTIWRTIFVNIIDKLQKLVAESGVDGYNQANRLMYENYLESSTPDGKIVFLAADPDSKVKGIGSALLSELEIREKGKEIYLYTDSACSYQFYEHRGFRRVDEKDIVVDIREKKVPLTCMLYSKKI